MFIALVTTVMPVPSCRSGRVARARATSLVVVPPFSATVAPGATRAAAARPMRCFSGACLAVLYRSGRSYETWPAITPPRVLVTSCCRAS